MPLLALASAASAAAGGVGGFAITKVQQACAKPAGAASKPELQECSAHAKETDSVPALGTQEQLTRIKELEEALAAVKNATSRDAAQALGAAAHAEKMLQQAVAEKDEQGSRVNELEARLELMEVVEQAMASAEGAATKAEEQLALERQRSQELEASSQQLAAKLQVAVEEIGAQVGAFEEERDELASKLKVAIAASAEQRAHAKELEARLAVFEAERDALSAPVSRRIQALEKKLTGRQTSGNESPRKERTERKAPALCPRVPDECPEETVNLAEVAAQAPLSVTPQRPTSEGFGVSWTYPQPEEYLTPAKDLAPSARPARVGPPQGTPRMPAGPAGKLAQGVQKSRSRRMLHEQHAAEPQLVDLAGM